MGSCGPGRRGSCLATARVRAARGTRARACMSLVTACKLATPWGPFVGAGRRCWVKVLALCALVQLGLSESIGSCHVHSRRTRPMHAAPRAQPLLTEGYHLGLPALPPAADCRCRRLPRRRIMPRRRRCATGCARWSWRRQRRPTWRRSTSAQVPPCWHWRPAACLHGCRCVHCCRRACCCRCSLYA